ncbi:uncharacterized protein METZ01_LOCUS201866 [marine metagenome]|uniref:Uncharacterized protein n=1 Tax=marine metagenome TaxID=408172 RepID=A0A382EFB0_9ZZZZ
MFAESRGAGWSGLMSHRLVVRVKRTLLSWCWLTAITSLRKLAYIIARGKSFLEKGKSF